MTRNDGDVVLARTIVELDRTLAQIEKLAAMGRTAVENDEFLPLAAQQLGVHLGHDAMALPEDWRDARPYIPWRSIRGLRNRLAHDYHQIDFDIVWSIFTHDVPSLRTAMAADVERANELLAGKTPGEEA